MKKIEIKQEEIQKIIDLCAHGKTYREISESLNIKYFVIVRLIKELNLTSNSKYKKLNLEEIQWLKDNWDKLSIKECAQKLNKNRSNILIIANKLGLKRKRQHHYLSRKLNIDPVRFLNITEPEIAYFLGLVWADGTIRIGDRKIGLAMAKEDLELLKLNNWIGKMTTQFIKNKKNPTWKEIMKHTFKSRPIYNLLVECDYKEKSISSPSKILSKIPENLHSFFFRGWFDGDGNFSKTKSQYNFCIAGALNQNWTSLIELCKKLNIEYKIQKTYQKRGNGSTFIFHKKKSSSVFANYIYSDLNFAPYLQRKYEIWQTKIDYSSL